jgi:hypothetical protein
MPQTPKLEGQYTHDWLIREWLDIYCREVVVFRHAAGVPTSYSNGMVTEITGGKHGPLAVAANAAGILMQDITLLASATDLTVLVLKRGPALVNEDALIVNGQVLATVMTALAALSPPILAYKEPIKQTSVAA